MTVIHQKEQQFLSLLNKHKGILHKVSRMYMDNAEDREDLQQEIIIQLWKSYDSFQNGSEFSTWMYRVAVNTAITFFKKEKSRVERFSGEIIDVASEEDTQEKDVQLEAFYKAVQSLSPVEKALIFYFMEGLSHKETALQLGLTEVNVRVKLNRTKEKLQSIIKKQGYEF